MRTPTWEDIYKYFLGEVTVGDLYNSPIPGRRDSTPSFKLYKKGDKIHWMDFGLTDQYGRDPENLVQYLRGLSLDGKGYYKAQEIIEKEVKRGIMGKPITQLKQRPVRETTPYVATGGYQQFELDYWNRFGITERELIGEDIFPVRKMSWGGESGFPAFESTPEDPAFIYWWNRNPASWKIYRPKTKDKRDKFRQQNVDGIVEGFNSLVKGTFNNNIGIISSSRKDGLVLQKAFDWKLPNVNPKSEKDRSDLLRMKDKLLTFAPKWFILYDADEAGYVGSKVLAESYGHPAFTAVDMRGKLDNQKDFADYVDTERGKHSYSDLTKLVKSIINGR